MAVNTKNSSMKTAPNGRIPAIIVLKIDRNSIKLMENQQMEPTRKTLKISECN